MKVHFPILVLLLTLCIPTKAQNVVDKLFLDMRSSFHQEISRGGSYDSQLVGDYLNFHILGHITPTIDYRIRQRLNKKVFDEKNMFNATDFMYINWQATPKLSFMVGKQAVLIGGYEYDAVPIDVYFYSKFCENLYQGFTFGASATYQVAPMQNIVFQVCNSPLSLGFQSVYAYNLAWSGRFAPWWHTIWSVNFVEDTDKHMANYISLGNHFTFNNIIFDIDIMNRAGFGQKKFFLSDITLISKFIWSVGKWNICAKAGYEVNSPDNVDANGRAYDIVIAPGTQYIYAGAGLEWFPLGRDNARLHLVWYGDNAMKRHNIELGVTWRIDIINR
ncbi:MAG: hypothetical protein IJ795_02355 [Bacteroidales bacterium]|nr:hypothetical protein [Bacteroidales bacterium]